MMTGGADVLDALVAGVNIVELDPNQTGVGWSGLPNADGVVQLDSCCMHGPKKRAGGVAGIEGVRTPSQGRAAGGRARPIIICSSARARRTSRASMGIKIEDDLNTEKSRASSGSNGSAAPIRCTTSIRRSARRRGTTPACRWCAKG